MSERKLLVLMTAEQADAFARLVEAAERGDGGAACSLGDMYREGLGGLRYSPRETYRWYAKSALAGDANGQNNLGACYEHGLGCAQSYPKAVKWYRMSVAQALGTASMNLGYCYLRGHGVPADEAEALRRFSLAARQGEERAVREVERLGGAVDRPDTDTRESARIVDESQAGRQIGLIGPGGVPPCSSNTHEEGAGPYVWRWPETSRAAAAAVLKDDCFDLPEPGSAYDCELVRIGDLCMHELESSGRIPPLPGLVQRSDAEAESPAQITCEGVTFTEA